MSITYQELEEMLADIDIPDSELAKYFIVEEDDERGFASGIRIDPGEVDLEASDDPRTEAAVLIGFTNGISRRRRKRRFKRAIKNDATKDRKIIVTEGDSWFQFPFILDDVIDHLSDEFNIYSVGAAGDTTKNMVFRDPEYLDAIEDAADFAGKLPDGFMFSSGGNDILGERDGTPVFDLILQQLDPGESFSLENAYVEPELEAQLNLIKDGYQKLISEIRLDFPDLPIFFHAYDRVFPYNPMDSNDKRKGKWIQPRMEAKGITAFEDQRAITTDLLDRFIDIQTQLAAEAQNIHVLATSRPLQSDVTLWHDEIHPTSEGYRRVVNEFLPILHAHL